MSGAEPGAAEWRIALRGSAPVVLHASGFTHPSGSSRRFTPYGEVLHVSVGARALRIGTGHGVVTLARARFAEPGAATTLAGELLARVTALPDGASRMALQAALESRQAALPRPWLGFALAVLCAAFYALALLHPTARLDGEYLGALGLLRESWRLVTAQLLHANFFHLATNSLGLIVLGGLLERQIGALRTGLVAAAAGVGTIAGCTLAGYAEVVGVSGLVSGFAGALVALEVRRPDLLPAALRLPRRLLIGAVFAEFFLLSFVPGIAHAAHAGGLLAGALAALATAPRDVRGLVATPALRRLGAASVTVTLAALLLYGNGLLDPARAAAVRGERLLAAPGAPPVLLNNHAWTIATADDPTEEQLAIALRLARRAVRASRRMDPNLLDTLAEVYFRLGRTEEALAVIDRSIELAPGEPYFEEQRRRFTGERAADDRPEPPAELPGGDPDAPERERFEFEGPGIRV